MIMSVKSIGDLYVSERTALAGIVDSPGLFGKNTISSSPGWDFIFGSQDSGIRQRASERGWLVKNDYLNTPFLQSRNHNFQFRSSIEPLSGFRIQLDANRLVSENFQEIFRYNSISDSYISLTPGRGGNFLLSFLAIKTAFVKGDNLKNSPTFEKFVNNRKVIWSRLNELNSSGEYGLNSQDVLIPAFISAYSDSDPSSFSLKPFPKIPIPNWRIDFSGLSKIKSLSEVFQTLHFLIHIKVVILLESFQIHYFIKRT